MKLCSPIALKELQEFIENVQSLIWLISDLRTEHVIHNYGMIWKSRENNCKKPYSQNCPGMRKQQFRVGFCTNALVHECIHNELNCEIGTHG